MKNEENKEFNNHYYSLEEIKKRCALYAEQFSPSYRVLNIEIFKLAISGGNGVI